MCFQLIDESCDARKFVVQCTWVSHACQSASFIPPRSCDLCHHIKPDSTTIQTSLYFNQRSPPEGKNNGQSLAMARRRPSSAGEVFVHQRHRSPYHQEHHHHHLQPHDSTSSSRRRSRGFCEQELQLSPQGRRDCGVPGRVLQGGPRSDHDPSLLQGPSGAASVSGAEEPGEAAGRGAGRVRAAAGADRHPLHAGSRSVAGAGAGEAATGWIRRGWLHLS